EQLLVAPGVPEELEDPLLQHPVRLVDRLVDREPADVRRGEHGLEILDVVRRRAKLRQPRVLVVVARDEERLADLRELGHRLWTRTRGSGNRRAPQAAPNSPRNPPPFRGHSTPGLGGASRAEALPGGDLGEVSGWPQERDWKSRTG